MEALGKVRESHGSIREVIFLNGYISKFQLNENLASKNKILLTKANGKVMEASKKGMEASGMSICQKMDWQLYFF